MKSPIRLVLVTSLAISPTAAMANETLDLTSKPLHEAIAREALRLSVTTTPQGAAGAPSDWTRVRNIRRRSAVTVTVKGSEPPRRRYFVGADDGRLLLATSEFGDTTETLERSQILEVRAPVRVRGSKRAAKIGVGIGLAGSALIFLNNVFCGETYSCQPALTIAVLLPVGTGIAGYYAAEEDKERVIYNGR